MIDPTSAEILKLRSGLYTWCVTFSMRMPSRCGRAPTYDAAVSAIARVVEGMRVDPDKTVRESLK